MLKKDGSLDRRFRSAYKEKRHLICEFCSSLILGTGKRFCSQSCWNKASLKEKLSYGGIHDWIARTVEKEYLCSNCKQESNTHWANVSGRYFKDVRDWLELCPSCHRLFDSNFDFHKK